MRGMAEFSIPLEACEKCGYKQPLGLRMCRRCNASMSFVPPPPSPLSPEAEQAHSLLVVFVLGLLILAIAFVGAWFIMRPFGG